jgi:hypothetical protein
MNFNRLALTVPVITFALAHASAEVSRFDVLAHEQPALQGRVFGDSGTVEKITAHAMIALDPIDPHNAVIADLDRAPRNSDGKVEASTDVVILRPAHPNGTLLFEVLNRGRKLTPGYFDDTDTASGSRLEQSDDAGNGFLLAQGYTLVWAAWQGDIAAGVGMKIAVPVVPGVTGPSREEWTFTDTNSPKRVSLSYPLADRTSAKLTVRNRTDDERQAMDGLSMTVLGDNTIEITRPAGAAPYTLYELTYMARDPTVMGMGLAAIRDVPRSSATTRAHRTRWPRTSERGSVGP